MKKTTLLTTVAIVGGLAGQLAADSGETRNVVISTDISMGLDCVNVFGSKPPIDTLASPIFYSRNADPRLTNFYLTLTKSF